MREIVESTKVKAILFYNRRRVYSYYVLFVEVLGNIFFFYYGMYVPGCFAALFFLIDFSVFAYGWWKTRQMEKENENEFYDYEDVSDL